jgi:hypothetical protein
MRSLGPALTADLVERFAQRDLARRLGVAIPLVTIDAEGWAHPMLLSYLEMRAYSPTTLGLVIQTRSGSARNLELRRTGTLLVVEPDAIVYVKTRLVDGPLPVDDILDLGLGYFLLDVRDVLQDAAGDWEGGAGITSPVRYQPVPRLDEPWVKATLRALERPRARA